jgi:hypothetical protein
MAVSVDTVYRTVLLILNKEQRGYMTPDEFNKTAAQVQLEIFESYFDDLNQQLRIPDNDSEYSDRIKNLQEKISVFEEMNNCVYNGDSFYIPAVSSLPITEFFLAVQNVFQYPLQSISSQLIGSGYATVSIDGVILPTNGWTISSNVLTLQNTPTANSNIIVTAYASNLYKLGTVIYNGDKEVQYVRPNELLELNLSTLTKPSISYPVYTYKNYLIKVLPSSITSDISVTYLRKPSNPLWAFTTAAPYYQYVYNAAASINFELHPSEQTMLITKILLYSGIIVNDPQVIQIAAQQAQAENINSKS